jgi:hypothetical protein
VVAANPGEHVLLHRAAALPRLRQRTGHEHFGRRRRLARRVRARRDDGIVDPANRHVAACKVPGQHHAAGPLAVNQRDRRIVGQGDRDVLPPPRAHHRRGHGHIEDQDLIDRDLPFEVERHVPGPRVHGAVEVRHAEATRGHHEVSRPILDPVGWLGGMHQERPNQIRARARVAIEEECRHASDSRSGHAGTQGVVEELTRTMARGRHADSRVVAHPLPHVDRVVATFLDQLRLYDARQPTRTREGRRRSLWCHRGKRMRIRVAVARDGANSQRVEGLRRRQHGQLDQIVRIHECLAAIVPLGRVLVSRRHDEQDIVLAGERVEFRRVHRRRAIARRQPEGEVEHATAVAVIFDDPPDQGHAVGLKLAVVIEDARIDEPQAGHEIALAQTRRDVPVQGHARDVGPMAGSSDRWRRNRRP